MITSDDIQLTGANCLLMTIKWSHSKTKTKVIDNEFTYKEKLWYFDYLNLFNAYLFALENNVWTIVFVAIVANCNLDYPKF